MKGHKLLKLLKSPKLLVLLTFLGGTILFFVFSKKSSPKPQFNRSFFGSTYSAEIASLNLNANLGVGQEGAKIIVSRKDSELEMVVPLSKANIRKEKDEVVYRVPEEMVELRYQLLNNGLKEDIILNKKPGNYEFSFELNAKNLTLKTTADGTPVFFDNRTGEYQFHFQKPFAKDAKGNVTYGVKYRFKEKPMPGNIVAPINVLGEKTENLSGRRELLGNLLPVPQSSNNRYILTATVDEEWLFNQERVFPVTIDPTIVYEQFVEGTSDRIKNTGSSNLETYYQELSADRRTAGLWHMNNNWNDSSGNGNHGTPTGAIFTSPVLGEYAGYFDGINNKITVSSVFGLANTNITIEAWVNLDSTSEDGAFVKIGDTNGYGIGVGATSMEAPGNNLILIFESVRWIDTKRAIGTGWHHTAMTIDNVGVPEVFIDGVSIGQFAGTKATNPTGSSYFGGYTVSGFDRYTNCLIDEVRISDIARTPEEIQADAQRRPSGVYTSQVFELSSTGVAAWNSLTWTELGVATGDGETLAVGSTGNLVAKWDFNQTSGTTAPITAGSCGSTCQGTLTNFADTSGQDIGSTNPSGWTADNRRWGAGALMFDGTDDYVNLSTALNSVTAPPLTVEAWVKIRTQNGSMMILQQNESATNYYGFRFGIVGTYQVDISYGSGGLIGAASRRSKATDVNTVAPGQWYHLVGVIRGETDMSIYVNGVDVGGAYSGSGGSMAVSGSGNIGRSVFAATSYFNGVIDSTRVYSRALSASEVLANYNAANIELQTRVGDSADPNDGTWEVWKPTTGESQILSMDSDSANWTWDNTIGSTPKYTGNESTIKTEGNGSLLLKTGYHTTATLALFHFEETSCSAGRCLYNSSGDGYDGAPTGELVVVDGFYGKARYFDGNQDYMDVGTSYHPANITIEAWVKPDAVDGAKHTIITQQRGTSGPSGAHWTLAISAANKFQFATYNGAWVEANGSITPQVGRWYHVAGSYDGANLRLFVNGTLEAITSLGTGISYLGERGVKVGAGEVLVGFGASEFFKGVIDEVRIHNTGLLQINLQEIYKAGRDHRLSRNIGTVDLSSKLRVPFDIASDRQGTFLEATLGESDYANYSADATNTVGLWHLDDGAGVGGSGPNVAGFFKDDSGNANNGTDTGGETILIQGKIGKARKFDGINDYITVADNSSLNPNNVTVEAWIKTTTTADSIYVKKYNNATPFAGYALRVNQIAGKSSIWMGGGAWVTGSTTVNDDNWHYIAATCNGSAANLYVDGKIDVTANQACNPAALAGTSLTFGAVDGTSYFFNGIIDEVRISNSVRTADEIRQAYEVDKRSHQITIDFKAELSSSNLITGSGDYSFTIDSTGAQRKGDNLYAGDKVIVKELTTGGNEYLAQGTVTSVTPSTGAVTVDAWDTNSTFPAGGYTVNATVFKWQREYFDITGSLSTHRNTTTRLTLRIIDGSQGASVWLDDFRSAGNYLTDPADSTITSSLGKRYFQYRAIFSSNNPAVSASLTSLTLDYEALNAPTGCLLEEHRQDSQIIVKWNDTNTAETGYQIQKNTDGAGFSDLITTAADATSYNDGAVSGNHTYQYRARAEKSGVYSDWCYFSQLNLGEGSFKFEGIKMEGVRID